MNGCHKQAFYNALTWPGAKEQDIDFLLSLTHQYTGKAAGSVVDIACGQGDYARLLAAKGLRVVGLESDADYLDLAEGTPAVKGQEIQWEVADLRHFALDAKVDLAICLRNRLTQLLSNEDLIRHFIAVANALNDSGIYIIELPHPRHNALINQAPQIARGQEGLISVERRWPVGPVEFDFVGGIVCADEELTVVDHEHSITERNQVARRFISVQEITLLAIQSESMRVVGSYGGFAANQPLDNSDDSPKMIVVLQKVELPLSYLSPKLEVRPSETKGDGFGMFARQKIERNELLLAYGGHVVTGAQRQALANDPHQFSLQIEEDLFLTSKGTLADYVNHSCDPNAGIYGATMLTAMRVIEPGEEVCWDYAMSDGSPYDEFPCTCEADNCRLKVTGNDWQIPALWERYAGYFSPYLQRRIDRLRAAQEEEQ